MVILKKVFTYWVAAMFFSVFLLLYPIFWISVQNERLNWLGHLCYRIWGLAVFVFCFVPLLVKGKRFGGRYQCIYVANHTSYLDIPVMYLLTKGNVSFLGKSSLGSVPLFGYLYKRLHILVDRKARESKIEALEQCRQKLESGYSLIIFPEGTIPKTSPVLNDFKDGAFKLAIEKQVPIVPVSIPFNWKILPDNRSFMVTWHVCRATIHDAIETKGLTENDLPMLREKAKFVIEEELIQYIGDDYRQRKSEKNSSLGSVGV